MLSETSGRNGGHLPGKPAESSGSAPAVGGGIPFLFNLLRARRVDEILEVGGILNGTTNLHAGHDAAGKSAASEEALKLAQQAGYAEAGPHRGRITAGTRNAKSTFPPPWPVNGMPDKHDILCEGITSITKQDMEALNKKGYACKLLARAARQDGGISAAYVEPTAVPARSVTGNIGPGGKQSAFCAGRQRGTCSASPAQGAGRYATGLRGGKRSGGFGAPQRRVPLPGGGTASAHRQRSGGPSPICVPGHGSARGGRISATVCCLPAKCPCWKCTPWYASARARGEKVFFAGVCE